MCNLAGGWPRSQQAPVARKRFCIEDWALPWSRKGIAGALVRAIMRTQAAVLPAARSTCRSSRKDYPQFAEFTQHQTLAYEA
jgi:hypothetical protein